MRSHVRVTTQRVPPTCWAHQGPQAPLAESPQLTSGAFTSLALDEEAEVQKMPAGPWVTAGQEAWVLEATPAWQERLGSCGSPSQGGQSNGGPRGSTSTWRAGQNTTPSTWNKLLFCVLVWSVHGHR